MMELTGEGKACIPLGLSYKDLRWFAGSDQAIGAVLFQVNENRSDFLC